MSCMSGLSRIYGIIPKFDTIYYIREMEIRIYLTDSTQNEKQKEEKMIRLK